MANTQTAFPDVPVTTHAWLAPLYKFLKRTTYFTMFHDFEFPAGSTLPVWLAKQDTSAAGSPTLDYLDNATGGLYVLQHDNTSELQKITVYGGDKKGWDIAKGVIFETRLKIDGTAAAVFPNGTTRLVAGLASDRNATLSSVVINAWFRVEGDGAGRKLQYESDDNTTDTTLAASGVSYAEGVFVTLRIDATDLAKVKFYINGKFVGSTSMAAATGNVQPFIELQKDSGVGTVKVTVDYLWISGNR